MIYILDKFGSALELDQQPGKCHQLGMLTQKMLPSLQLQRFCPAPSKRLKYWSDSHCSHLSASWWAEQAVSHWKPCRAITGAPQGPHDASAITFIQVKWHLSFIIPRAQHKIPSAPPPVRQILLLHHSSLLSSIHGLTWWKIAYRNSPGCSWKTMFFMAWLNWLWLLMGLAPALRVSMLFSTMKKRYLQRMQLWKSQHCGSAK